MSPYRPAYRAAGVRGSESIRRRADREIDGDKVFNAKSRGHSYITATTSSALMSMQVRQDRSAPSTGAHLLLRLEQRQGQLPHHRSQHVRLRKALQRKLIAEFLPQSVEASCSPQSGSRYPPGVDESNDRSYIVGRVPPSTTCSAPMIDDAASETRNPTISATSSGRAGRPSGIPPSASISD